MRNQICVKMAPRKPGDSVKLLYTISINGCEQKYVESIGELIELINQLRNNEVIIGTNEACRLRAEAESMNQPLQRTKEGCKTPKHEMIYTELMTMLDRINAIRSALRLEKMMLCSPDLLSDNAILDGIFDRLDEMRSKESDANG